MPGVPGGGLWPCPPERRMTCQGMCDSLERIQEGGGCRFVILNEGKQMSDADGIPKVEIYTKWGCGFCARAKALLGGKGIAFDEYDITMGGPQRAEMLSRANGGTTVPQIFIGGVHVGGSDDLAGLERTGKLDMLLGR